MKKLGSLCPLPKVPKIKILKKQKIYPYNGMSTYFQKLYVLNWKLPNQDICSPKVKTSQNNPATKNFLTFFSRKWKLGQTIELTPRAHQIEKPFGSRFTNPNLWQKCAKWQYNFENLTQLKFLFRTTSVGTKSTRPSLVLVRIYNLVIIYRAIVFADVKEIPMSYRFLTKEFQLTVTKIQILAMKT